MKKISKIIFGSVVIIMTVVVLYFLCDKFIGNPFRKDNAWSAKNQNENSNQTPSDSASGKKKTEENFPISKEAPFCILPYKQNIKNIGEEIALTSRRGITWCVNDAIFSKKAIDTDAGYYEDTERVEFDEEYNILNEFTYVSVPVTLKNATAQEEIYINSFKLIAIDPQTKDIAQLWGDGELEGYKTKNDLFAYDKSYAKKIFSSNEVFSCNLVFFVKEQELENYDFYIRYSETGDIDPEYKATSMYVRLK